MKRTCSSLACFLGLVFAVLGATRTEQLRAKLASGDRSYVFVAMHRGDWRHFPENSRGAIEGCIACGADIVELDVARTKDGRFILNHDNSLDRTTTGKGKVSDHTLEELRAFRLRDSSGGKDAAATEWPILTLEEALEITKGRILMNIDHFDAFPQEILSVVEKCGALKEVLVKAVYGYEQTQRLFGEKYWPKVVSGELLFMPIIRFAWGGHKTAPAMLASWFAHEPRPCSMYELCFDSEVGERQIPVILSQKGKPRVWVNTLWDSLDNKRPDKLAQTDPDAVWGWCAAQGVTMIQTDCGQEAVAYLKAKGRRELGPASALNANREEVLKFFSENVYGVRPDLSQFPKRQTVVACTNDPVFRAERKTVELNVMTPLGERTFRAEAFVPRRADGRKPPVFVYIAFRPTAELLQRPIPLKSKAHRWPVEQILARGCATVAFDYQDVFPDRTKEIYAWGGKPSRAPNSWGAISAWALAASRVMDWLETEPSVDASHVAVAGLSRLGKTSLWAGATDPRFAYVIVDESGCMGARVSRCNVRGETVDVITRAFPHWFAPNCRAKFRGKDGEMPIDQDSLVAACAPRLLAISSAEDDEWSCPAGEHLSFESARSAWGKRTDRAHYFFRRGPHDLRHDDWADYLDFAASHGWMKLDGSWCSCGTSITWYNSHRNGFWKGYQDCVRETLGFSSLTNCGLNGSCVRAIPKDLPRCDWYTIEHGINDWGHSTPVGTWADYENPGTNRTFFADYRRFVDRIREVNPAARIVLCTPRRGYGFRTYLPATSDDPKNGIRLFEYAQAVREIAYREGFEIADFFAEAGEDAELAALSIDLALHPNTRGFRLMSDILVRAMLRANRR